MKENAHGVMRQVPVEHQVKKEGGEELQSISEEIFEILRTSGYFQNK